MRFAAILAIVVGVGMFGQWAFFLAAGQVPELDSEPIRIGFHLAGEFVTAAMLIAGGSGLLAGRRWGTPVALVALGMLFYTAIVSPGYFGQRGEWAFVVMFAGLIVVAAAATISLVGSSSR